MKNKIKLITLIFLFSFSLTSALPVMAGGLQDAFKVSNGKNDDPLDKTADKAGYNTKADTDPLNFYIRSVTTAALSVLGVIFLCLLILGGWLWMTAEGDESRVEKSKQIIKAAVIGLVIVLAAYAISWFVIYYTAPAALEAPQSEQ